MSKRKPKTAETPAAAPAAPSGPVDIADYAKTLPAKRAGLVNRLNQITANEQQLAQAKQQTMAEINELGGEAKAVAGMLGKSIEEVLGMAALNAPQPGN